MANKTYKRPLFINDTVTSGEATNGQKSILVPRSIFSGATDNFIYNINILHESIHIIIINKGFDY